MHALNESKLRLSQAIESQPLPDGTCLMKQTARAEYLALNREQQEIIGLFRGAETVQAILHSMLTRGAHVRIRGFYDLVLNAMNKGFLIEGESAHPSTGPVGRKWGIGWGPLPATFLSLLMIFLGASAFYLFKINLPETPLNWVKAAVFFALGLSLAGVLGGCVLSGSGRLVYSAGIRWNRILPFFAVDARDAFMGGRFCEAAVALQMISGPFLLAAIAWFSNSDDGLLGCCLAALVLTSPFGNTAAHNLLHAIFRKQYQLPRCAEKFLGAKVLTQIFNWKESLVEEKYLLIYSTYAICWLGALVRMAIAVFHEKGNVLLWNLTHQTGWIGRCVSSLSLAFLALAIAAPLGYLLWVILKNLYRALAPYFFKAESSFARERTDEPRPADDVIAGFLGSTLLFSQLSAEDLKKVAAAVKFVVAAKNTLIIRERDLGDSMFVVYSGKVEVLKEDEAGENSAIATLSPGDVFGEIALLDRVPRTSTVRSVEATRLFVLAKADFERLLVSSLGSEQIKTIVQVCAFLRRNPLFADWHPKALLNFAKEFQFQDFLGGDTAIRENQPNEFFYIVYEGKFEVRKKGVACATLGPGEFCGEISLLRDTPATAEVVAARSGRCLKLGKEQFLKFVSQDFLSGLAIETTLESRMQPARTS